MAPRKADRCLQVCGRAQALPPKAPLPPSLQTLAFWRNPHAYLELCRKRYGGRFTISAIGMAPLVFMSGASDIRAIVRAPANILHPGAGGAAITPLVGAGSFMLADEEEHLKGRRAILPALHQRLVREHAEMVHEIVAREVAGWPLNIPVGIHPYLRALTLKVILQTIFGGESPPLQELHDRLLAVFSVTDSLILQEPQLRRLPRWRGVWRRFLFDREQVDKLLDRLIENGVGSRTAESCLLSMLIGQENAHPSGRDSTGIKETLMSVILAGHETTASQLAWAFQLLAHNPTVLRRLSEEVDEGGERYLTATIQEVLRHRPVFLFTIPRVVRRPFEVGGTTYRPPTQLAGCIHLMHHDAALYSEPHRFCPERFLSVAPDPELWMPWGGGRKRCPGHHLAMLEMQTILRVVLSQFEIGPVGKAIETGRWRSVIVTPGRGSRIVLRHRRIS
jgi:cytochrome P450